MSNIQKIVVLCVVAAIVVVGGFFMLNNYIYTEKQEDGGVVQKEGEMSEVLEEQLQVVDDYSRTGITPHDFAVTETYRSEASGLTVQLLSGDEHFSIADPTYSTSEQKLIVLYADGTQKELFAFTPSTPLGSHIGIKQIQLSSLGNYVNFVMLYWESSDAYLFDLQSGENILNNRIKPVQKYIDWDGDENFVVLKSDYSPFDGSGSEALYVSKWKDISTQLPIFEFGYFGIVKSADSPVGTLEFEDIRSISIDSDRVLFEAIRKDGSFEKYQYNVKTEILNPIE